jgi:hypothetical protein
MSTCEFLKSVRDARHNSPTSRNLGQGAIVQSSMANLGTRLNSRVLCVISVKPKLRARAAKNRSLAPIRVPNFFKWDWICASAETIAWGNQGLDVTQKGIQYRFILLPAWGDFDAVEQFWLREY